MSSKTKWPLHRRVEVEWRDSASSGQWGSKKQYRKRRESVGPVRSIGYLLTHDKDVVQLVQSQSLGTRDITDAITIPRECVTKIRKLKGGL